MQISKKEVRQVARLARLNVPPQSEDQLAKQIGTILEYIQLLNEVDTKGVPPTSHAIDLSNAFRDDQQASPISSDKLLANAPQKDLGAFIVPKVIE